MKGILMDEDKVHTIRIWSSEKKTKNGTLNNLFEVQQLIGFAIITNVSYLSILKQPNC